MHFPEVPSLWCYKQLPFLTLLHLALPVERHCPKHFQQPVSLGQTYFPLCQFPLPAPRGPPTKGNSMAVLRVIPCGPLPLLFLLCHHLNSSSLSKVQLPPGSLVVGAARLSSLPHSDFLRSCLVSHPLSQLR